jgi:hypothetical protein
MTSNRRKRARQRVTQRAVIRSEGARPMRCIVQDISEGGAKLKVGAETPDRFDLLLSPSGSVRRHCRVIWRTDEAIGVSFVDEKGVARKAFTWRGEPWQQT